MSQTDEPDIKIQKLSKLLTFDVDVSVDLKDRLDIYKKRCQTYRSNLRKSQKMQFVLDCMAIIYEIKINICQEQ